MSSPVMYLDVLLQLSPDEVLFDFLAQCGLTLLAADIKNDTNVMLRIAAEIERAPLSVRECILAAFRRVALLADEAGLDALRAAATMATDRIHSPHLSDAPAAGALWMHQRHPDLFDAAYRMRARQMPTAEAMILDYLRQPLPLPDDPSVSSVRLREVTLLDETTGGEITVKAPADQAGIGVLDLLANWMPIDNPVHRERFRIITAKVDFGFLPQPSGRPTRRRAQLVLKRRGGHNLADFAVDQQVRLDAWLSRMQSATGQTLSVGQLQRAI